MKYFFFAAFSFSFFFCFFVGAKQKETGPSQIFIEVSDAFCHKMDECSKEKIPHRDCVSQVKEAFQKSYDKLSSDQKAEVDSADGANCSKSIQSNSCEQLKGAQKLTGCDFIEKLGS